MKVTILMPTIWKLPDVTEKLIVDTIRHTCVDQVLICHNSKENSRMIVNPKVFNYFPTEPRYFIPGVEDMLKYVETEFICFLSDDLQIYHGFWDEMLYIALREWHHLGMIGLGKTTHRDTMLDSPPGVVPQDDERNQKHGTEYSELIEPHGGWCALMVMRKDWYPMVPHQLRMWAADTYLTYHHWSKGRKHFVLDGRDVVHHASHSSKHFHHMMQEAQDFFNQWVQTELWNNGFSHSRFKKWT